MNKPKVLVTGATGFIGRHMVQYLLENSNMQICAVLRREKSFLFYNDKRIETVAPRNIDGHTYWGYVVPDTEVILHLAARAHVMHEPVANPLDEFRKVNVDGTLHLAHQAALSGVKRFVFVSSIGVHGSQSKKPFSVNDHPNPAGPYAVSKLEAEEGLRNIAEETGMELVIIRPTLVYGSEAPGNFRRLVQLVHKGIPLPLGLVRNKRSLLALDNLVDLIMTCIDHPAAAGQTFLASDGEDLSTPELIRKLASAIGRPARLLPVPPSLLRLGGKVTGKKAEVDRLIGSLQVDISHTCDTLGWRPPVSVDDALWKTGRDFVSRIGND